MKCGAFDVLQTSVNLADQECIELTLPQARARQMGVIAKRSLANTAWKSRQDPSDSAVAIYSKRLGALNYDFLKGSLDGATSMALRFTLSVPGVDMALIGSTNPEHWQRNMALLAEGSGSGSLSQGEFDVGSGSRAQPRDDRRRICTFEIQTYSKGGHHDPNQCYTTRQRAGR